MHQISGKHNHLKPNQEQSKSLKNSILINEYITCLNRIFTINFFTNESNRKWIYAQTTIAFNIYENYVWITVWNPYLVTGEASNSEILQAAHRATSSSNERANGTNDLPKHKPKSCIKSQSSIQKINGWYHPSKKSTQYKLYWMPPCGNHATHSYLFLSVRSIKT